MKVLNFGSLNYDFVYDVVINEKNKAAVEQIIKFFTYKGDE